jgi:hypothetical protein
MVRIFITVPNPGNIVEEYPAYQSEFAIDSPDVKQCLYGISASTQDGASYAMDCDL